MTAPSDFAPALLTPSRRRFLLTCGALSMGTNAWAARSLALDSGRLVVVFLRGAYDGLSVFVPWSDPDYPRLRRLTQLPAPDGTAQTPLSLDARFALHPALAPLLPLWRDGVLAFLPAAGSPDPTRSHFDAQYHWETGLPGKTSEAPGWLNRLAALDDSWQRERRLIGVGEANPRIVSGPVQARLIARGQSATQQGVLANEKVRLALLDLYAGDDRMAAAFREGARSRTMTARELMADPAMNAEMNAADNGAGNPAGLALDARHLATLMRNDASLRLGFLSAGGWDTHANQGGVQGQLANNLGNLGRALTQLRSELDKPGDVILVVSEFGRTCAENGTGGTDHGHGNALWVIGNGVRGGRWHGQWEGLAQGNLHEARDLPVLHDFRAVIAQVLRQTFGLADSRLADLFPGASWDTRLDGLMKKAA